MNKAIMRCLVKNLAMFGLGLYVYAGEDLPEDAAPQPIKRVKLKDGSIMQAAEFAATHEGMCADCYKATRLNVA